MRNWFEQLSWKLQRFMEGRCGFDSIVQALLIGSIVCMFIDALVGTGIVSLVGYVLLALAIVRMLSRNVGKCQQQAAAFDAKTERSRASLKLQRLKAKNRKTTCYFTCSNCKAVYSVPKGRGKVRSTCPKCHTQEIHNT